MTAISPETSSPPAAIDPHRRLAIAAPVAVGAGRRVWHGSGMLRLALCMLVAATAIATTAASARADGARALPAIPKSGRVTIVKLDKEVDLGLAPFLDRVASAGKPGDLLVIDINTLGGRLDAAIRIRDALLHTAARTCAG